MRATESRARESSEPTSTTRPRRPTSRSSSTPPWRSGKNADVAQAAPITWQGCGEEGASRGSADGQARGSWSAVGRRCGRGANHVDSERVEELLDGGRLDERATGKDAREVDDRARGSRTDGAGGPDRSTRAARARRSPPP